MEEEEEPKEMKIFGNELDSHEVVDSDIKQFVDNPPQENVNGNNSFEVEYVDERVHLQDQDVDCATIVMGEDQLAPLSLMVKFLVCLVQVRVVGHSSMDMILLHGSTLNHLRKH